MITKFFWKELASRKKEEYPKIAEILEFFPKYEDEEKNKKVNIIRFNWILLCILLIFI